MVRGGSPVTCKPRQSRLGERASEGGVRGCGRNLLCFDLTDAGSLARLDRLELDEKPNHSEEAAEVRSA